MSGRDILRPAKNDQVNIALLGEVANTAGHGPATEQDIPTGTWTVAKEEFPSQGVEVIDSAIEHCGDRAVGEDVEDEELDLGAQ